MNRNQLRRDLLDACHEHRPLLEADAEALEPFFDDTDRLEEEHREAHELLDGEHVPREGPGGAPLSLPARVGRLMVRCRQLVAQSTSCFPIWPRDFCKVMSTTRHPEVENRA